jgi:hypothetical protein
MTLLRISVWKTIISRTGGNWSTNRGSYSKQSSKKYDVTKTSREDQTLSDHDGTWMALPGPCTPLFSMLSIP